MRLKLLYIITIFACLVAWSSVASAKVNDFYDFETKSQLSEWVSTGGDILLETNKKHKQKSAVKISRTNTWDFNRISRNYENIKGSLVVEAMIQGENIIQGNKSYHTGLLEAVIIVKGKEVGYVKEKLLGTFNFKKFKIKVDDLTGDETVKVRVGLHHAKGILWIDDIKIYQP